MPMWEIGWTKLEIGIIGCPLQCEPSCSMYYGHLIEMKTGSSIRSSWRKDVLRLYEGRASIVQFLWRLASRTLSEPSTKNISRHYRPGLLYTITVTPWFVPKEHSPSNICWVFQNLLRHRFCILNIQFFLIKTLTNSMVYGTRRSNAAFTRALQ